MRAIAAGAWFVGAALIFVGFVAFGYHPMRRIREFGYSDSILLAAIVWFVAGFFGLAITGFWMMALGIRTVPQGFLLAAAVWVSGIGAAMVAAAVAYIWEG